jgi:V-type H+-transporting ATPase proteolipid subunit
VRLSFPVSQYSIDPSISAATASTQRLYPSFYNILTPQLSHYLPTQDVGAAAGTAKAGVSIMQSGIKTPEQVWRNLIPIVMAGVNGIYGLITSIVLVGAIKSPGQGGVNTYSLYTGAAHLAAGLCCGLSGLGSGVCIGVAGEAAISASGTYDVEAKRRIGGGGMGRRDKGKSGGSEKLFVSMVLIQVFAGNIALFGLIASIILSQQTWYCEY